MNLPSLRALALGVLRLAGVILVGIGTAVAVFVLGAALGLVR